MAHRHPLCPCWLSPIPSNTPGRVAPAPGCVAAREQMRLFDEKHQVELPQRTMWWRSSPRGRGRVWWALRIAEGGRSGWSWSARTAWTPCRGPWTGSPASLGVSLCRSARKNKHTGWFCQRVWEESQTWVAFPAKNWEPGWRTPAADSRARARPRPSAWPRWRCRSPSPWSSSAKKD